MGLLVGRTGACARATIIAINTQLIVRTHSSPDRPVEVARRIGTWLFRRFPVAENTVSRDLARGEIFSGPDFEPVAYCRG
jgi:hypothetical protein